MADARLAGELKGDSLTVSATANANGHVLTEERRAELMAKKQASIARWEAAMEEREAASNGAN